MIHDVKSGQRVVVRSLLLPFSFHPYYIATAAIACCYRAANAWAEEKENFCDGWQ